MSGRGRFNTRSSAQNQHYNQNQQKTTYNTRNTSYSSPAYSTPTQAQQPAAQPAVQPQQVTPQRQQPQVQPAQQAQTPVQYQQPQYQQTPVQQKVELPVEVAAPKDAPISQPKPENAGQLEDNIKMDEAEGEEGKKRVRKWQRRTPDFKIPRRIRKRRQNARLKNLLAPKNAMMVLHELHPELKMSIIEQPNAHNQISYTVEIELDGKVFQGMGMSKMAAKQAGSEAALKAVLLKKLEENNVKLAQQAVTNKSEGGFDEDVSMSDISSVKEGDDDDQTSQNGGSKMGRHPIPEDDVPWGSLASFALYKLFSEWQSQGFQLPAASGLQNVAQACKPQTPQAPTPMKKIPDDANQKHPVQLLNQLRPGSQYVETREGMPPNLTFTYTVKVDDLTFKGVGNSKKEAKKVCAKHALEHLGVVYND